jgi:hypothetical protein
MASIRDELPAAIKPGSRWVLLRGQHSGSVVQIENQTSAGQVKYRNLGGGRSVGSASEDDEGRIHTRPGPEFLALYVPEGKLTDGQGRAGKAFRQRNAPRPKEPTQPLGLNGVDLVEGLGLPFTMEIVDISPSMAQAWLDRGQEHNREPTRGRVVRLTNSIRRGEWQVTGDTIKLDKDGLVLDGRHRLLACIAAGMPIRSLVVRGVPTEVFSVLDTGKNRTPGDVMGIAGYKNRVAIASVARGLILIDASGRYDPPNRLELDPLLTHTAQLRYAQEHPEVEQGVLLGNQVRAAGLKGGAGLLGLLFALLIRVDENAAGVFAEHLGSGANLDSDSPILRFRNRLISDQRMPNGLADREHLIALGIKAWNAWRAGEAVRSLTWHPQRGVGSRGGEAFPVAV